MSGRDHGKDGQLERPKDLIDFHLRWKCFKSEALEACADERLSNNTRETVRWLVAMADRIGMDDLR